MVGMLQNWDLFEQEASLFLNTFVNNDKIYQGNEHEVNEFHSYILSL